MNRVKKINNHLKINLIDNNKDGTANVKLINSRKKGHEVPKNLKDNSSSASIYKENLNVKKLSFAERSKTLINRNKVATLSTNHFKLDYPYGSVINIALNKNSDIITFVSKLSEHYANLSKSNKCSILISESQGENDKLANARCTFVNNFFILLLLILKLN